MSFTVVADADAMMRPLDDDGIRFVSFRFVRRRGTGVVPGSGSEVPRDFHTGKIAHGRSRLEFHAVNIMGATVSAGRHNVMGATDNGEGRMAGEMRWKVVRRVQC